MKKVLLLILLMLTMSTSVKAWNQVPFTVSIEDDESPLGHGLPKSPMRPPSVYIEGYTLAFVADHPDYVLNIKDEHGEVVYTTTVYSAETQVTLLSSLSGSYTIELIMGNWKFIGFIILD